MTRAPMTPAEREERRACMKRAWAEGRFANRRKGMHPRHWTPEQNDALGKLLGTMPIEEVAEALNERFKTTRTVDALTNQVKRLGLSRWVQSYGLRELETVFGFDHRVIVSHWVTPGHLAGRRWSGRGPNAGWWFDQVEVERFIREKTWLIDLARMPRGHRLTRLAELALRADPWIVGQEEIGRVLGMAPVQVKKWMSRGFIPYKRRPCAGPGGTICVRGRDVASIREAIARERERTQTANFARFAERARARSAEAVARARQHADRLHGTCRNGHPRTPETTLISRSGKVQCRTCRAVWRQQTERRAS